MSGESVDEAAESLEAKQDAWVTAVLSAAPWLFRAALRIVRDEAMAEDVVAETYLRAWQHRRQLSDRRKLTAWLRQIGRNCALDLRRRQLCLRIDQDTGALAALPAPDHPAHERLVHEEILDRLPEQLKVCARLSFVDGLGYSEIADLQCLPLSTVKGRIYTARQRLRKEIEMTAEPVQKREDAYDDGMIPLAPDHTLHWREMKVRMLGVGRVGQKRLYSAAGKPLSRIPAAVSRSRLFNHPGDVKLCADPQECAWTFWELSGKVVGHMGIGTHTNLPNVCRTIGEGDRLLCSVASLPAGNDGWVRVRSLLIGDIVKDESAAVRFRWDFANEGTVATAVPGWGAIFAFTAVAGPGKNTCVLPLAYSSARVNADWAVSGVSTDGQEHQHISIDQANSSCAEGHLAGVSLTLPIPPDQLREIVFRPRWHARANWGKIRIPPI